MGDPQVIESAEKIKTLRFIRRHKTKVSGEGGLDTKMEKFDQNYGEIDDTTQSYM